MSVKNKKHDIEQYENQILKDFEEGHLVSVDNVTEELAKAKKAAENFIKRDSRINIRLSPSDLSKVRKIAVEEGMPYQTLLSSLIHKFVTGRLVEKKRPQ